ncbi:MAG: GAF domain-containing protein [Chloroflexi bacterium]|nr:GAF domain-containing protein [Chloroflexota bacterium]
MAVRTIHPFRSVRGKLFFHHVAILAPFVVLGLLWVRDATMGEKQRLVDQLEARATRVVETASAIVQEETTVLRTIGELPTLEEGDAVEIGLVLSDMLEHHPLENNFYLIDVRGTRTASTFPRPAGEGSLADSELFKAVMRTEQPYVGRAEQAQFGRVAGQPVLPLAVPVRDHGGRLIGALVAELSLGEIQRLVSLGPQPDGSYQYVVDRAGQAIAHPSPEYARSLKDFSGVQPIRELLGGEEGIVEYPDPIERTGMIAVYKQASLSGLGVVSAYPSSALSTTMARTAFGIMVVFGVTFIFAVAAAYVVGNLLADRLASLADVVRAMGAGDLERRAELASSDEMGTIARGVNSLAERFRQERDNLENVSQSLRLTCDDVGMALASALDAGEAIRLALSTSARLIGVEAALGLIAETEDTLRVAKTVGPVPPDLVGQLWPLDDRPSVLGRAAKRCEWQQVPDLLAPELSPDPVILLGRDARFRAALVVPLSAYGRCSGVLVFFDVGRARLFTQEEVSRVRAIASEAAVAIDNARLQQQIKTANQQLIQSGLRLRTIIETIPAGIVVAGAPEGRITLANTAGEALLGRRIDPRADLHEQVQIYRLYHPEGSLFREEELPLYRSIVLGQPDTKEILVKRPDGISITILFSSAPMRDGEGRIAGGVGVFRDISEMKNLDRLKDEFISITSHELKSPLTVIRGYAQLLQRRTPGAPAEQLKWLQAIDDQSSRLSALVERLLDVSRIQTGKLEVMREPVDVVSLVRRVAEQQQVTTTLHQLQVHTDLRELVANCDRARIQQVLINLLDNAIKYSPKGGPIEIGIHRIDHEAQVSVRDHGIGIPREDQKRLFQRFYRAQAGKERPSGLGLGLYISYQTVALHGGRMWVESEPGEGSTFCFSLPLNHQNLLS